MKHKLVKVLTLFCFIGCIAFFIAYRSGKIEPIIQPHADSDFSNLSYPNSIFVKDSVEIDERMAPSKPIIYSAPKVIDTSAIHVMPDSIMEQQLLIMSSSKSAILFDKPFKMDTSTETTTPKYKRGK